MAICIAVLGTPIPQGSLVTGGRKGGALHYSNRSEVMAYRRAIQAQAIGAWERKVPAPMPIQLEITFAFQHPLSHYRNLSYQLKPEHQSALQTRVPDIDKLARAVLDALTGIVYEDDAQVASLVATKIYDSLDSTVICIRDLTPEGLWDAAETTDAVPMGNGAKPSDSAG